jgi:DNA-binding NtrC family response regulator
MSEESALNVLALVPYGMQDSMRNLQKAVTGSLTTCASAEELSQKAIEKTFAVAFIPAGSLAPQEWWSLWGLVSSMEPQPSILVYAPQSDFPMWAGVLDSGGFDVVVAPFTVEKLREAIASAAADFARRTAG